MKRAFGWVLLCAALLLTVTTMARADLHRGLLGQWSFDEGSGAVAHDSTGNGYDGTINGATWAAGIAGGCLSFDWNDWVQVQSPVRSLPPYSISLWMSPTSVSSLQYVVSNGGETSDSFGFNVGLHGGLVRGTGNAPSPTALGGAGVNVIPAGVWTHVCWVWDGTGGLNSMKLYLNGARACTATPSRGIWPNSPQNLVMGRVTNGSSCGFGGLLDEVRIYDRTLDEGEIATLAEQGRCPPSVQIDSPAETDHVQGMVAIRGIAVHADGLLDRVEIAVDEGPWIRAEGIGTWQYEWDTAAVPAGTHTISARSVALNGQASIVVATHVSTGTGLITAWGLNTSGQCDVPSPGGDFTSMAGGGYHHSLGVRSDGSIVAWGSDYYGQCDVPAPNSDFTAAAAGHEHSLGLKSDGTIVAWGWNAYGQCDVPAPNSGFIAMAAGAEHSAGLKSDGTIVGWGDNSHGQRYAPAPNSGFIAVAAGAEHSVGLKASGTVVAWGYNFFGQCTVPAPNADFTAIAAGQYHSLGLKSFPVSSVPADPNLSWNPAPGAPVLRWIGPNPTPGRAQLSFTLGHATDISGAIYDPQGRKVETLLRRFVAPGSHQLVWDGRDQEGHPVPSGVYLVRLATPQGASSGRIVVTR
jgi:hypothetical protein